MKNDSNSIQNIIIGLMIIAAFGCGIMEKMSKTLASNVRNVFKSQKSR